MTAQSVAKEHPINNSFYGFHNLFMRENRAWWSSKRWLLHLLLGVTILNGFLAAALFVLPAIARVQGEPFDSYEVGIQIFFGLGCIMLALEAIIVTQDAVIGEKLSGTAEWVLSKPVSRSAYLLSKLAANMLAIFSIQVVIQSGIAYGLFTLAGIQPAGGFFFGVGLMALHTLFYLILTLLIGVIANSRGMVLGVTLSSLLGGSMMVSFFGPWTMWTPWPLANLAGGIVLNADLPTVIMLSPVFTAVWCIVGLFLSLWIFKKVEL